MDTVLKILNTTVISIGDGPGLTVLQIAVALLTLFVGIWLARWSERRLSKRLEQRKVEAGVIQLVRRKGLNNVYRIIRQAGHQCYLVGGAIRY